MAQSKSERSRQVRHRDWLLLGDANRQRSRAIEKRLADPPADSNLTRLYYFRSDQISDELHSFDVHHAPTAEEVSDFDNLFITRAGNLKRVPVKLSIDSGQFIDLESERGRFTIGFDMYGRRAFFAVLGELQGQGNWLVELLADATVQLPEGWKR